MLDVPGRRDRSRSSERSSASSGGRSQPRSTERTPRGTAFFCRVIETTPRGSPAMVETVLEDGRLRVTKEPPEMFCAARASYASAASSSPSRPATPRSSGVSERSSCISSEIPAERWNVADLERMIPRPSPQRPRVPESPKCEEAAIARSSRSPPQQKVFYAEPPLQQFPGFSSEIGVNEAEGSAPLRSIYEPSMTWKATATENVSDNLWSTNLDPIALGLFSEAKVELGDSDAHWADDVPTFAKLEKPARNLLDSWTFKLLTMGAILTDVTLVCTVEFAGADKNQVVFALATVCILTVLFVDIFARMLAQRKRFFKSLINYLELLILLLCIVDEIITTNVPFAVGRLARAIFMIRNTLDVVVDAAVDKLLEKYLGDILYISPENATARPSEGVLVIEKTHFRPKAFEGIHMPFTVKGGFIELVYIDLNLGVRKRQEKRDLVVVLKNIMLLLGPTMGSRTSIDQLTEEDVENGKNKLVEMITRRTDLMLGSRSRRPEKGPQRQPEDEQHQPTTFLGKLRQKIQILRRIDLGHVKVDLVNLELRFEDFNLLDRPISAGFRARQTWCRITPRKDMTLHKSARFRATAVWSHQWMKEDGESDGSRESINSSRADGQEADDVMRLAMRCTQMCAWCDHGEKVTRTLTPKRRSTRSVLSRATQVPRATFASRATRLLTSPLKSRSTCASASPARRGAAADASRSTAWRPTAVAESCDSGLAPPASGLMPWRPSNLGDASPQANDALPLTGPSPPWRPTGVRVNPSVMSHALDIGPEAPQTRDQTKDRHVSFYTDAFGHRGSADISSYGLCPSDNSSCLAPTALAPGAAVKAGTRTPARTMTFTTQKSVISERGSSAWPRWTRRSSRGEASERSSGRSSRSSRFTTCGNGETFTQFFERDPPEVSAAVRVFKRQLILERFKIAARAAVEKEKQRRRIVLTEFVEVVEVVMQQRLGSRIFNRFWDRILPHDYVLLPMPFSIHALSQPPEGDVCGGPPLEVMDVEMPRLSLQLSRSQMVLLCSLQRYLMEWLAVDRKMSRRPVYRLKDRSKDKSEIARSWWLYAVGEIVVSISPGSNFATNLQVQRLVGNSAWYTLLLVEQGLYQESQRWDLHRIRSDFRQSGARALLQWKRTSKTQLSVRLTCQDVSPMVLTRQSTDCFAVRSSVGPESAEKSSKTTKALSMQGPLEKVKAKFWQGRLRWHGTKESDLKRLQVALPLMDIVHAHSEAKRLVLEEVNGKTLFASWFPEEGDEDGTDAPTTCTTPSRSSLQSSEISFPSLASEMDTDMLQDMEGQGPHDDDPGQARIHVTSIKFVLVDERPGVYTYEDHSLLREIVRCQLQNLTVIWSRTAPMEEWEILTKAPDDVADHAQDPPVLAGPRGKRGMRSSLRAAEKEHKQHKRSALVNRRISSKAGVQQPFLSPVPFEASGLPFSGWQGIEVSIANFWIVHCRAPAFAPSLHNIISRGEHSQSCRSSLGGPLVNARGAAPKRRHPEEKGLMFLLRAAQWTQEGQSQGIAAVHACALRVMEYPPLGLELLSFFCPQLPHPKAITEDPLLLADRRDRLQQGRELRHMLESSIRVFELTSGIQNAGAHENTRWRLMLCTGDISVTVVTPYTSGGRFLVHHTFLPGCSQHFERTPCPATTWPGPSWRAAVALPGAAGTVASATARALGVDLLTGEIPRGPAPTCNSPRADASTPANGSRYGGAGVVGEAPYAWGAINAPWRLEAPVEGDPWYTPDWTASECVKVHLMTLPKEQLEAELATSFAAALVTV